MTQRSNSTPQRAKNTLITVFIQISAHFELAPTSNKRSFPPSPSHLNSLIDLSDNEIEIEIEIEKVLIRDFPEDGLFFRVFQLQKLAVLHLRVLLLPFIILLQSKHTTLAKNCENLISAQLE